ncbi:hypothetical protein [Pseudomonas sp.]|uniref:hypothetical protein n=1 Tax=Pseudomonas sp. TaxID=306 RepID=UPI00262F5BC8|nr:hypothetical protein [Pseudomonas sp.]
MKTSKEVREIIADKVRENIINGVYVYEGIQYKSALGNWMDEDGDLDFGYEYRVKPQTITINGVEIPKPLGGSEMLGDVVYYCVDNSEFLYKQRKGQAIVDQGVRFAYATKEEAIRASKALFGIKE